jgi:hypothetical protein
MEIKGIAIALCIVLGIATLLTGVFVVAEDTENEILTRFKIPVYTLIGILALSVSLAFLIPSDHILYSMVILNHYPNLDSETLNSYIHILQDIIRSKE